MCEADEILVFLCSYAVAETGSTVTHAAPEPKWQSQDSDSEP